jgi:hypothetical protein
MQLFICQGILYQNKTSFSVCIITQTYIVLLLHCTGKETHPDVLRTEMGVNQWYQLINIHFYANSYIISPIHNGVE